MFFGVFAAHRMCGWGISDTSCQACSAFLALAGLRGAHWPEEFVSGGVGSSSDYISDIIGRGLPGTEPLHVTAVAEQVPI